MIKAHNRPDQILISVMGVSTADIVVTTPCDLIYSVGKGMKLERWTTMARLTSTINITGTSLIISMMVTAYRGLSTTWSPGLGWL